MISDNLKDIKHGWQVSERQLKAEFGVGGKWPDEGCPMRRIGNTVVWVNPRNPKGIRSHRAIAVCDTCMARVSAGRLHQHLKVHPKWLIDLTPDEELDLIEYNTSIRPD